MIVTKSWLNEFVDLDRVENSDIYKALNSIGLEVDSINDINIPAGVVVGKIISCEKHPNADKLSLCQIDIGLSENQQIVCGASNVVDAEFVAVATLGTKLSKDFEIKPVVLREVESNGMVCSASELGLPNLGDGIMILDDSIGELVIGKELNEYKKIADTIIEIELTANRGDCLSINGVARDLSVALKRKLVSEPFNPSNVEELHVNDVVNIDMKDFLNADLSYSLVTIENIKSSLVIDLRLAIVKIDSKTDIDKLLRYSTHSTGVILRSYKGEEFKDKEGMVNIELSSRENGVVEILSKSKPVSVLGISQIDSIKAEDTTSKVLIEASYIYPDLILDSVAKNKFETDELYYNTSRGSEPELSLGIEYIAKLLDLAGKVKFLNGTLDITSNRKRDIVEVDNIAVCNIIGKDITKKESIRILKDLGFEIDERKDEIFIVTIPLFRHDVKNLQDIIEEIVRIIGIDNIPSKTLEFKEKVRINDTSNRYKAKKAIRNRAVSASFYENLSYIFVDSKKLDKYGFDRVEESLEVTNPIADDFDALRTTMMINMLDSVKRNISYSKKSIALFEIGNIFNTKREEKEVISFIYSGQSQKESVVNSGKSPQINFESFVEKVSSVIGNFELVASTVKNGLIHPYQSADIIINSKVVGYLSKLHPVAKESYGVFDTFIAQIDFDAVIPKHINANPISNFQGVYKDLSIVIDKKYPAIDVMKFIKESQIDMLKDFYCVDIYEDESLEDKKSMTIRFFIQSLEKTLKDKDIEAVTSLILKRLKYNFMAKLR